MGITAFAVAGLTDILFPAYRVEAIGEYNFKIEVSPVGGSFGGEFCLVH
jgi:hypothetical protein